MTHSPWTQSAHQNKIINMSEMNQTELVALFAYNLRAAREAQRYSQEELASRAGLDRTYVSGCERGVRNVSLKSLEKLANALSMSPAKLLTKEK